MDTFLIFWIIDELVNCFHCLLFTPMLFAALNKHCHGEPFTPGVSKLCQVRSQVHSEDKAAVNGILKRVKFKIVASCLVLR